MTETMTEQPFAMIHLVQRLLTGLWMFLLLSDAAIATDQGPSHQLSPNWSFLANVAHTPYLMPILQASRTPPEHLSIPTLLTNAAKYHQQFVAVNGIVTQPELHLDESELFLDFVFRLSQGKDSIIVFGRHDRTLGAPSISMDLSVEVIGIFWKERDRGGSKIIHAIEAFTVSPYPSTIPEST